MIIELSYRKVVICTADGQNMIVRHTVTKSGDRSTCLAEAERCEYLERIEFLLRWGAFRKKVPIDLKIEKAVAIHLRRFQGAGDISFDCYAFANLIEDHPSHKVRHMSEHWDIRPLEKSPGRGSIVFLMTEAESRFHHAACYLGMGLYLSVWGAGGDLEIATFEDMRRGYGTNEVFLATPKPKKLDPA